MASGDGVRWHCPNRECNWSMVATMTGESEVAPWCICGSQMQKAEIVPAFRYLDFLREDTVLEKETGLEEE